MEYWTGIHKMDINQVDVWIQSSNSITLPVGTYIFGFRAYTVCLNEIYVSLKIDNMEQDFVLWERELHLPMSCEPVTTLPRTAHNVMIKTIYNDNETPLYFYVWAGAPIEISYEIWALRIK